MRHKISADLRRQNLWRGCIGAWAPLLGQSGTTLQDNSGYGKHCTLTNMDAAADWVVENNGYTLDCDGVDDTIRRDGFSVAYPLTMSIWARARTTVADSSIFCLSSTVNEENFEIRVNNTGGSAVGTANGTATSPTGSFVSGTWNHFAFVCRSATDRELFINGMSSGTSAVSRTPSTITRLVIGGHSRFGGWTAKSVIIGPAMVHARSLTESEIRLLAGRPSIAYETVKRRSYKSAAATGFKAAWLNQRSQIIGGGAR